MSSQQFEIKVESGGKIKLPKEVMDKMNVKEGDEIQGILAKKCKGGMPFFYISSKANLWEELYK